MASQPEKHLMSMEMLLGEIKARLDSLSEQLKGLEAHVGKGIEKLEENVEKLQSRVAELEKDQHKLKGMIAISLFIGTIIVPIILKKLGL